ncbi:MAG TPA: putative porin [Verrucomicrobiae bacterium]|nr:putative porin [Verrucomicrobiae bacterium]
MRLKKARRITTHALKVFLMTAMGAAMRATCQDSTNAPAASDSNNPLLNLFIKKGFVTQQEAAQVEAEAESQRTNASANLSPRSGAWSSIPAFKDLQIYGDARLRYEDRDAKDPLGNEINLQRFRYAVRLGLRGDLFDQFYFGVRLDTSPNARSPFVTFGSATASSSAYYYGPFGKSQAGVDIGQVYLGWHPEDWLDVTLGKMPNPLYSSTMVWNSAINPEGFAERFKYPVGPAQFFANFGQFIYDDLNPNIASGNLGFNGRIGQFTDNIFMFAWQGGLKYQITPNFKSEIAATIYNYVGLHQSTASTYPSLSPYYGDPYVGEGAYYLLGGGNALGYSGFGTSGSYPGYESLNYPLNQVGLNDLKVIEIPFEFDYRFPEPHLEARLFGDFAYNLNGKERAEAAASAYNAIQTLQSGSTPVPIPHTITPQTSDVKAYQIGVGLGSDDLVYGPMQGLVFGTMAPRHSWEVRTYWQHIEQYSLDPNILDTDFFNALENLQGIYVAASYAFTGNFIGTFRYGRAWRINNALGTGGSSMDIPQINPIKDYDIYQIDLTLLF